VLGVSGAVAGLLVVAREPFLEMSCDRFCGHNPLLVAAVPALVSAGLVALGLVTAAWCVAVVPLRAAAADLPRPGMVPVLLASAAACAALGWIGHGVGATGHDAGFAVAGHLLALGLLQARTLAAQLGAARARRRVRRLSVDLALHGQLGRTEAWLRETVRDASLRVRGPGEPARDPTAATTVVRRGDVPVATVEHRPGSSGRVQRAISPIVAMALDNDRLHAEAVEQYEVLVESRREIVHLGDAARRSLERDLHDGAQQRLLLLGMTLSELSDDVEAADQALCREGIALAARALAELRDIATGVFPVVLDQLGLVEAIRGLAETAAVPVELRVEGSTGKPLAGDVERAAYRVVAAAVHRAAVDLAPVVLVQVVHGDALTVTVTYTGRPAGDSSDDVDRVGALRGEWTETVEGERVTVQAVLPCE
jgi:signal transduction histidine kinase